MESKASFLFSVFLFALVASACERPEAEVKDDTARNRSIEASETSQPGTEWSYERDTAGIDEVPISFASVRSTKAVALKWPAGDTFASMVIQKEGKELLIYFEFPKTVVQCSSSNCDLRLKFDGEKSFRISGTHPADNSPEVVILNNEETILKKILKAKVMKIEVPIFNQGRMTWTFNVAGLDEEKLR